MTKELITDEMIDKKVRELMEKEPQSFLIFMLATAGRECKKINAATMKFSTEMDIEKGQRYKAEMVVKIKPLNQTP